MSDPITRLNAALGGRYTIEPELGEGGVPMKKWLKRIRGIVGMGLSASG